MEDASRADRPRRPTSAAPSTSTSSGSTTLVKRAARSSSPTRTRSTSCRRGSRERLHWLSDEHAARVSLSGTQRHASSKGSTRPARAATSSRTSPECREVVNARTTNWTAGPCPNPRLGRARPPGARAREAALDKLWDEIVHVCRLDADDPVAAWRERMNELIVASARAADGPPLRRAAPPGPGHRPDDRPAAVPHWLGADFETVDGLTPLPEPPDRGGLHDARPRARRRPRVGDDAARALRLVHRRDPVEFEGGRAVKIDADEGADALRSIVAKDDGASRLGEIALVDGEGRIGPLGTVFYETLLDENAASHIALGNAYDLPRRGRGRPGAHQQERHPRRLHDREPGARRRRDHARRRDRSGPPRRRLARSDGRAAPRRADRSSCRREHPGWTRTSRSWPTSGPRRSCAQSPGAAYRKGRALRRRLVVGCAA